MVTRFGRGIAALAALAALLVGVPVVLLAAAGNPLPERIPSLQEIQDFLARPDVSVVLVTALAIAGWIAWALFALSVVLRLIAHLVDFAATPRLPGRRTADVLVSAVVAMAAGSPLTQAMASSTTPYAVMAEREPQPPDDEADRAVTTKWITVRRSDTLWSLAEEHLGDGRRYKEIVDLNTGRINDEDWLRPGWRLRVPAQEQNSKPSEARPTVSKAGTIHQIRDGDTLIELARHYLGDGERYPEIFNANKGVLQADGYRLTDPDELDIGWQLHIPTPAHEEASDPEPRRERPTTKPTVRPTSQPTERGSQSTRTPTDDGHEPGPLITSRTPCPSPTDPTLWTMPETQRGIQLNVGGVLGYGGYLAAAITGLLAFRRKRHRVRRRPGQRLASPAPPMAGTERVMRAIQDPAGIERVNHVLRLIAKDLTSHQRPVPALSAIRLTGEHIELHLISATDQAPAPARQDSTRLWTVPNDAGLPEIDLGEISSPYPALVTLGRDQHGNHVLVDLETAGAVNLLGPQDRAIEVLSAMAIEIAASPWADDIAVTVVGFGDELPDALPGTVRHVQQLDDVLGELAPKVAERQRLIASAAAPDVRTARTNDVEADVWTPEILLCAEPPTEDQTAQLAECVLTEPRLAITAVVTVADPYHAIGDGWHLDLNEPYVSAQELPWPIRLQVLTQLEYTEITAALRTTGQPAKDAEPGLLSLPVQVGPRDKDETHVEPQPDAPMIRVLGPVEIEGAKGSREEGKEGQLTALACYLALHPGTTSHAIQEALWPGRRTTSGTRTTALSKLRRRLGANAEGNPFLPVKADGYRLADVVGVDWNLFLELARKGMVDQTDDGTAHLEKALQLVRGRPFEGVNYTHYSWIDPHLTEMTAAIVDVAHELAQRHHTRQDFNAARTAITKGKLADPGNQALWIDLLRTEAAAGNPDALRAAADRYLAQCADLDIDPEPEVTQLLDRSAASIAGQRPRP